MTHTAKHTPGPWVVTEHSSGMICVAGPDNKDLCAVGYNRTNGRDDVANASLIAAAPAMYEALALVAAEYAKDRYEHDNGCNIFYSNGVCDCTRVKVRAALAQAEGKHV